MVARSLGLLLLGSVACQAPPPDAAPAPFPEDTGEPPVTFTGTTSFPLDTGFDEPQDDAPEHLLHVAHVGSWTLSGAPYSSLSGVLTLTEIVDELEDTGDLPDCQVALAMTGVLPELATGCAACDFVFDVEFFVSSGDLGACRAPELPAHGVIWRMGYSSADAMILLNYEGVGVYVPWYPATQQGDTVTFAWEVDLGLALEEEE